MNAAVRAWLLKKAQADLSDALADEKDCVRLAAEMKRRESGVDGWNGAAWKGEGKKAAKELLLAKGSVARMRKVVKWLKMGR